MATVPSRVATWRRVAAVTDSYPAAPHAMTAAATSTHTGRAVLA